MPRSQERLLIHAASGDKVGGVQASRALFGSFWILDSTIGLLLDRFGIDLDEETRAEIFSPRDFISLSEEQTRDAGRNDPCPCGSGVKFKRCHGS
jgi:hypothetical protein